MAEEENGTEESPSAEKLRAKAAALAEQVALNKTLYDIALQRDQLEEGSEDRLAAELAAAEEKRKAAQEALDLEIQALQVAVERGDLLEEEAQLEALALQHHKDKIDAAEEELDVAKKAFELEQKRTAEAKRALEVVDERAKSLILSVTGIGTAWQNTFIGSIAVARKKLGGLKPVLKQLKKSLKETFTMENIAGSLGISALQGIFTTTIANITSLDDARAEFAKNVGMAADSHDDAILQIQRANMALGVSRQEATQAMGELLSGISGLRHESMETRIELANQAHQMKRLGVNYQQFSKFQNFVRSGLKMTAGESGKLQKRLVSLNRSVAASTSDLMNDYERFQGDLAVYGKAMTDQFEKLALMSDKAAVKMDKLVAIGNKLDTFRGAAKAVGQLNTVLGRNVFNIKKMIGLPIAEKIQYLNKQLNANGQAFKNMNRWQQRQIATILGTDVATILKMQNHELDKQIGIKKELNVEDEYMKNLAKEATPAMLQLKAAFQEFAVALVPIVKAFRAVVGWFAEAPAYVKWLIAGIPILGMVFFLFIKPVVAAAAALKGAAVAGAAGGKGIATGAVLAGKGIMKGGLLASKGAIGWAKIAVVFALVAIAVAAIILSFALLAKVAGPHTLEAAGAISMLLGVMVAMIAIAGAAGAFTPAAVAITIGLGLIAIAALILIAIITAMVPALEALGIIFSAIAKVGGVDPFVTWIAGLYNFADAVQDIMPRLKEFRKMLLEMSRLGAMTIITTGGVPPAGTPPNNIIRGAASVGGPARDRTPAPATIEEAISIGLNAGKPTAATPTPAAAGAAVTTTVQTTVVKAEVMEMKGTDNTAVVQEIKALGEKLAEALLNQPAIYNFEGKINENVLVSFINKHAKEATRIRSGMWNLPKRR